MADRVREEHGHGEVDTPSGRLKAGRTVLAVALVLAIAATLAFGVPAPASAAGVLLLAGALVIGGGVRPVRRSATLPAASGSAVWPDTSMKLVVDALDDPCFVTDATGIVRYQNEAATGRFGPPRPGDPLSFKLRVPELLAAVERAGRGRPVDSVRFTERVPTERQYVAVCRPIRTGRRDVRNRDRVAFVLVRIHDETELMRLERMRGDFIANASHELRTPLSSLSGFIETLLGPARNDEVNRERFLKIMQEQAFRMARLIDDLLSLSRIEMKAHVRPDGVVDLSDIVAHVADVIGPLAGEQDIAIALQEPPAPTMVRGDRDELIQVVTNLVENAVKYGRTGGRVTLRVLAETGQTGLPGYALSVADDGPGIPPEHLPRLTERFYRVDEAHSRRRRGTGLGLAIVKHIVNRHHGRLTIRSTLGEGSVFTVWLPAAGPASGGAAPERDDG